MKTIKKELIWFVSITLPVTYGLGLFVWHQFGLENIGSILTMYVPATVVLLLYLFKFRKPIFKNNDLGLRFTGWKYWIIAPCLMTLLSIISYGISYLFNPEMFSSAETIKHSLSIKGFYWGNIYLGLIAIFLINGIVGSLLDIHMFLGEELGWRGFMTPRLLALVEPKKAFVIGGTIWALWHVVMIAQGLNYPDHLKLGIFMMVLMAIPVGIIIQYFYFRSKSIFVAALAHAALNKSAMSMAFVIEKHNYNTLLYGPTGIIGIILFYIVAIYLYNKIDWKKENTFKMAAKQEFQKENVYLYVQE
jgi:membrane protease YdiL (CAAX protease family)